MSNIFTNLFKRGEKKPTPAPTRKIEKRYDPPISPGRVSQPDHHDLAIFNKMTLQNLMKPTFNRELIDVLRQLYKINPDVGVATQDMFKLANTGHVIDFPNNTDKEAEMMRVHLDQVSKKWSNYTFGVDGLSNRFFVQCLVSGAISIEAVPNKELSGISNILLIDPEQIYFKEEKDGTKSPYQKNPNYMGPGQREEFIKLNPNTYKYIGVFNDTDSPYGVPGFMTALDSIKTQHDMRVNLKHIMEVVGMVGFLEAKMEKPNRMADESSEAYRRRLESYLSRLKTNLIRGMKDGVVTGFLDDHEFKMNSTTKDLSNIDKPWMINQQAVANGLGVNGSIIGVSGANSESGSGVLLSKLISQLRNMQMAVEYVWEFIYELELRLAGFNVKGIKVKYNPSTISDELKVQQGKEIKIRNLLALYQQGIISQQEFAWEAGYDKPDQQEPREPVDALDGAIKKQQREADKDDSDRKVRDKNRPVSKRGDQDTRKR